MTRLLTKNICTMTELREPQNVLDRAGGKPVAVLKNSKCVGYFVPVERISNETPHYATMDELLAAIEETQAQAQPVLDYLKDK
jgi:antitoxin StbD